MIKKESKVYESNSRTTHEVQTFIRLSAEFCSCSGFLSPKKQKGDNRNLPYFGESTEMHLVFSPICQPYHLLP
jgi:hypothetical protein